MPSTWIRLKIFGELIGGAVVLPTSSSSPALAVTGNGGMYFAKAGLVVRPNAQVEVIVARKGRENASLRWGGTEGDHLLVGPCNSDAEWLVFAGGYLVGRPRCVDLVVRTDGEETQTAVGVGAACPGQNPPPERPVAGNPS